MPLQKRPGLGAKNIEQYAMGNTQSKFLTVSKKSEFDLKNPSYHLRTTKPSTTHKWGDQSHIA